MNDNAFFALGPQKQVCLSVCLSVATSDCLFVFLSVHLSVCLSVCLSCLSICFSALLCLPPHSVEFYLPLTLLVGYQIAIYLEFC